MTGEKINSTVVPPECDQESRMGTLLPYGEDPGDDCYKLPVVRKGSEVRYSSDDGAISGVNENGSTVYTQTIGSLLPENS